MHAIDDALERIEEGTYGLCEKTGDPISRARLEAMPWARYTKRHQAQIEATSRDHR
ncbi:MAG: TraR/DksA C4-type zinc finger protein [Phycisphaeraceae bacterium]|nr:TraR/DksA C4-type zinc finger protein [Phycisphaeraceae bacterium]